MFFVIVIILTAMIAYLARETETDTEVLATINYNEFLFYFFSLVCDQLFCFLLKFLIVKDIDMCGVWQS